MSERAQLLWAQRCAALIVESGLNDWQLARKKAARELALPSTADAPSDAEIIAEIKAYHLLYLPEEHAEQLAAQRDEALSWMEYLESWNPRLCGPVAEGWAHAESEIRIEISVEDEKALEIFFVNDDVHYTLDAAKDGALHYRIDDADWPLRVVAYGPSARGRGRWSPQSLRLTVNQTRALLDAVEG